MTRTETDSLGSLQVPANAAYGIHTARAVANFPITGVLLRHYPELVESLAMTKKACALANMELGALDAAIGNAIVAACDAVVRGDAREAFIVDMLQGGAGTSTNMNANEVIANLALRHLGKPFGDYKTVSPNDHVNLSQSTNDVYPTSVRLTMLRNCPALLDAQTALKASLLRKGRRV